MPSSLSFSSCIILIPSVEPMPDIILLLIPVVLSDIATDTRSNGTDTTGIVTVALILYPITGLINLSILRPVAVVIHRDS